MKTRIVRKFIIDKWPSSIKSLKGSTIDLGFIAVDDSPAIRLSRIKSHYLQTVSEGTGIRQKTWEIRLNKRQFDTLWDAAVHRRHIKKTRYSLEQAKGCFFIDQYRGELDGLWVVEVTFESITEAKEFDIPPWFGMEITFDSRFMDQVLAVEKPNLNELPRIPNRAEGRVAIGAIPYLKNNDNLEVVIISTKKKDRLIFPKGQKETGMANRKVAVMEALEEAGVEGTITGHPILSPYLRSDGITNLILYPLEVEKVLKSWDESKSRNRFILPIQEAFEITGNQIIHPGLQYLSSLVE